jgi:hypothetical protein
MSLVVPPVRLPFDTLLKDGFIVLETNFIVQKSTLEEDFLAGTK